METEFPQRSDFGDFPDEAFKRLPGPDPKRSQDEDDESAMDTDSEDEPDEHIVAPFIPATPTTPQQKPVTYDEIVVEQPPADAIFSIIFGPLADPIPKSFKDVLSRPDRKFWWEALCAEIMATIQKWYLDTRRLTSRQTSNTPQMGFPHQARRQRQM
jgi:hypothetical protein